LIGALLEQRIRLERLFALGLGLAARRVRRVALGDDAMDADPRHHRTGDEREGRDRQGRAVLAREPRAPRAPRAPGIAMRREAARSPASSMRFGRSGPGSEVAGSVSEVAGSVSAGSGSFRSMVT